MKHLVLGSSGQVGAYVIDHLKKIGEEYIEYDIVNGPEYDLADPEFKQLLKSFVESSDFVHFLAYDVGGSTYLAKYQQTYDFVENNVRLMQNTFEVLKDTGTPFYFASSQMSNMYDSVYGRLKAIGEAYTNAIGGYNVQFWNVYGYETNPEKTHVITDFIRMALTEGRILIRTDGKELRNFLYGADAAKMLVGVSRAIVENGDQLKILHDCMKRHIFDWKGCIPVASEDYNTVSIYQIAKTIAYELEGILDVKVFVGDIQDKTQTIFNQPPSYGPIQQLKFFGLDKFTPLYEGIRNIIEVEKHALTK